MLRIAVDRWGLSPRDFWDLTAVEFFSLCAAPQFRPKGINREQLEQLMAKFPDVKK